MRSGYQTRINEVRISDYRINEVRISDMTDEVRISDYD